MTTCVPAKEPCFRMATRSSVQSRNDTAEEGGPPLITLCWALWELCMDMRECAADWSPRDMGVCVAEYTDEFIGE